MNVIVIGGGAAGFFGAIACAEANPQLKVTLIEAGNKPLAKVRISGGGRCNVTHHCFEPARLVANYPRGGKALRGAFSRFQPQDTVQWYESRGVKLKTEADGRMFPITDSSETIIKCLIQAADQAGVELRTGVGVKTVKQYLDDRGASYFQVELKNERVMKCDRLLIAIAQRLKTCLRSQDFIARMGNDEFVILLSNVEHLNYATNIADRIYRELSITFNLGGYEVFIEATIGIAVGDHEYDQQWRRTAFHFRFKSRSAWRP